MTEPRKLAAVILAAGASSRMGRPKALLQFAGETFLDRLIACFDGIAEPTVVVLGFNAGAIRTGIARALDAHIVVNPDPSRGMLSSLQCGLAALPKDVDGVFFMPVDLPAVRRSTIEQLAQTAGPLVIPVFRGHHGHPVRVSQAIISELLELPLTAQARDVIHRHSAVFVEVDDAGVLHDVDTPAEYEALVAGTAARHSLERR